jgi:hypothetical protein
MTRKQIISKMNGRMRRGVRKHGRFDAGKDERDLFTEMQEELLDFMNYALMQIQKIEGLRKYLD